MDSTVIEERQRAYLRILYLGLLAIRDAGSEGKAKLCAIEADHLHNLPSLVYEPNLTRHHYYISPERKGYIEKLGEHGDAAYAERQLRLYEGPWKVLMTLALTELNAGRREAPDVG